MTARGGISPGSRRRAPRDGSHASAASTGRGALRCPQVAASLCRTCCAGSLPARSFSGAALSSSTKPQAKAALARDEAEARGGERQDRGPSSHSVVIEDLNRLLAAKPDADQLERMIYQELKLRLAELLLMRVDKITMATSVEARVPFLDHKLVEFAMSLPRSMKYRNGETKYILKRALRGIVPECVLGRKKQGFGAPINEWMFDKLGGRVEDTLLKFAVESPRDIRPGLRERVARAAQRGQSELFVLPLEPV